MKNIFLLPNIKSNGFHANFPNQKQSLSIIGSLIKNEVLYIYITSHEDLRENDFIITKDGRLVQVSYLLSKDLEGASKVVVTNDKELIKNDVQEIDNESLEWFITNSNFHAVEIEKLEDGQYVDRFADGSVIEGIYENYKIIIPKQENKVHSFCETPEENCTMNYCDDNGCQNRKRNLVDVKNKTRVIIEAEMNDEQLDVLISEIQFTAEVIGMKKLKIEHFEPSEINGMNVINSYTLHNDINCPKCGLHHIDKGDWSKRLHKKHLCEGCGNIWQPHEGYTFGV